MVGERVKSIRQAKGISQEMLAQRARINRSYLSHIENGKAQPTIEVVERLAYALEVPLGELLTSQREQHFTYDSDEVSEMYEGLREFLNDPDEMLLANPTPEEIEELKGIRFKGKTRPDKRFYRDALLAIRRRKRSGS